MSLLVDPADIVPYQTIRGTNFTQLFQHIPALEPLYFDWEKNYDGLALFHFITDNPLLCVYANIIYVIVVFGGQEIMKDRKPFDLKWPLAFWNLLLAVFSGIGVLRVAPHFFLMFYYSNWQTMCCGHAETLYGAGALQLWIQLFVASKLFELVDTVFIVLRKKPCIFLHWYHHITVFMFSWWAYCSESPGIVFVAMNYSVHSIMYFYYFLMAIKSVPKWFPTKLITVAQISQMVVGCYTAYSAWFFLDEAYKNNTECSFKPWLLVAGGTMYSTYLYLFVEFFFKRFVFGPAPKKKTKTN